MAWPRSARRLLPLGLFLSLLPVGAPAAQEDGSRRARKPAITIRATPAVAFAPARVFFVVEIRGGADDYEDFYCASVEWDWGDETRSQSSADCEPYEPGKSEIRRRFSTYHTFTRSGDFRVQFRLKKGGRVVGSAFTTVRIRPGVQEIG
ncbi:MAG TPA: hypothetical protein VNI83_08295 [Vicinamibacterales bacterium]|nr:hypothetical protein [Vicinamibacterales bacterium]